MMDSEVNMGGPRRRSREMALQLLFQREFAGSGAAGALQMPTPEAAARRFTVDFGIEPAVSEYGSELFLGVTARVPEIDGIIQAHSAHWKTTRMGLVDLSVMRIAVFEMKFLESPLTPNIAIDEAVEIAKKFGSTDSGSFVNGILDHVARILVPRDPSASGGSGPTDKKRGGSWR